MSATTALVKDVLVEAVGSSATPFVPVPFVDDWLFARLLRRIAKKVLVRRMKPAEPAWIKALVGAYAEAGDPSLGKKVVVSAARFVVRKLAIVLDVKKSHDVFGEAIAFAVALDLAIAGGWTDALDPRTLGTAIQHATSSMGTGLVETVTRAGRGAWNRGSPVPAADGGAPSADGGETRMARIAEEIAKEIEISRDAINALLHRELHAVAKPHY